MIEEAVLATHARRPRCATAATSPRSSSRTVAPRPRASTTARSRSWCRAASAAPASASCAATPTGFAHTADLSRGRAARRRRSRRGRGARARTAATRVVALERRDDPPGRTTIRAAAGDGRKARKVELLARADARRPRGERRDPPGHRVVRRRPPPHPRRQLRRPARRGRPGPHAVRGATASRSATPACRPAYEAPGRTLGFELFDEIDPEEVGAHRGRARAHDARRRPAPRGQAARRAASAARAACCSTRRAATASRPTTSTRTRRCSAASVGELVASPLVTLVDDGTYGREWGTLAIDDEGTPAQRNVLIENGVLTDYMWDLVRARKEGRASSGNGRRETYQHLPMVRMTNTFLLEGDDDPDDIIRDADYGLYCVAARRRPGRTPRPATSCSASPRRT